MANPNEYLVFEADQVLTNDHLNQLFYYVDQQNRWSRNKLLGIGIVCGLNVVQHPGVIQVTKGCGVTSQGYLIMQETANYSYYFPYAAIDQPADLPFNYPDSLPFYKTFCTGKTIYVLLTDDEYNALEPYKQLKAKTISSALPKFLNDFTIVLFLEATEMDLKNCDTLDCNNKGEKMQLPVRALLVKKGDLPGAVKDKRVGATVKLTAPEIDFKRYNVPYKDLQSAEDVLNAFIQLVDDNTLSVVAKAYSYCYEKYKGMLSIAANPFATMFNDLKKQRDNIVKNNPVYIQYFYDFIDDLIKAYYEFRVKSRELVTVCCPDENLFPLHLVLGEATANTRSYDTDAVRQYFAYSPLFDKQGSAVAESAFLFMRMQLLAKEFTIILPKSAGDIAIKITPGQYQHLWLSQRAIPYYYKVNDAGSEVYKYWSFAKTKNGSANFNLSYHSNLYNGSSGVINPLLYDIEYYNFFRIEGHIGLNYKTVLSNVLNQRQNYSLPFDVVAVSADQLSSASNLPDCNMQDIDTDYQLILSEFACKAHNPFCFSTKFAYPPTDATGLVPGISSTSLSYRSFRLSAENFVFSATTQTNSYKKGDFMRKYCAPGANDKTVGSTYLGLLNANGNFVNPIQLVQQPI